MKISNRFILVLILVISAVLRFYNLFDIPFTHDEFSALFRTQFDGFWELIEKGVKTDTHPAGVQVFLYYWVTFFGATEWVVKLPFIIAGIASVYVIYLIGKEWFNESVGLLTAAMLSSIQYTVMYSQIARPYISGLLISLLMVYYWTKIIKTPQRSFYKNISLFVIFGALCAYNHHFSLMFAGIVGLTGLFVINKKYLLRYLVSGIFILLLYSPHLGIFLSQLEIGGISWVAKPKADFIIKFLSYSLNFSWVTLLIILGILIYALSNRLKNKSNNKFIIVALVLFSFPFLIGFFYSIYINTVIQYSMLIFSFPYILFIVFGYLEEQKVAINFLIVSLLMLSNIYTLVFERKHYEVFYDSCFEQLIVDYVETNDKYGKMSAIIDLDEEISSYYIDKFDVKSSFMDYNDFDSKASFVTYLIALRSHSNNLFFSGMYDVDPEVIPIILEYYPKLIWQKDYAGGSSYFFSSENEIAKEPFDILDFDKSPTESWQNIEQDQIIPTVGVGGSHAYLLAPQSEYSMSYINSVGNLWEHKNDFIDITLDVKDGANPESLVVVCSMNSGDEKIYWGGESFVVSHTEDSDSWSKLLMSVKLSDIYIPNNNVDVKIYIWNKEKAEFLIDNFKIELRKGNKKLYGLINPIK